VRRGDKPAPAGPRRVTRVPGLLASARGPCAIRNLPPDRLYPANAQIRVLLADPAKAVPAGSNWFHEIKYDGYRLRLERDGDRVRLITEGGGY